MKIGIISNLYPPSSQGGAEVVAETMALGFLKRGHEVFVMTSERYATRRSFHYHLREQEGVRIYAWYPCNVYHYSDGASKPWLLRAVWHVLDIFNLHSVFQVRKIVAHEKPDIVITHNLMGIGFLIPRLLTRMKVRHIHVLHDVQLYNPSGLIRYDGERSAQHYLYSMIGYPLLMRSLFARVNLVISPSHFLLDFYTRHSFFKNIHTKVIPNPVSFPTLKPHTIGSGPLRLLFAGQLSEVKGAVGLAETVSHLNDVPVSLTLIGDGLDREHIVAIAKRSEGRIAVLDRMTHNALADQIAKADILIAPTLCYDTFPTIVAEALRCSVPVIVSDCGGAKEIVQDGSTGWIVPAGDWPFLASLLRKLAADHTLVIRAASQTAASVAHLTSDRYIDALLSGIRI